MCQKKNLFVSLPAVELGKRVLLIAFSLALLGFIAPCVRADTVTYAGAGNQTWTSGDADGDWVGGDSQYDNGDDVIFTNTGAGTIGVSGSLAPNSILFNNTVGNDFTFNTGDFNDGGSFTMTGGGNVSLTSQSMLPILGDLVVSAGTLTYNNKERVGSLSGSGSLVGTSGNNSLRYGWNHKDSTFSGGVTQNTGNPTYPSFDKVGQGTTTITSTIGALGSGGAGVTDGTLRMVDGGQFHNVTNLNVYNGGTFINDDTGAQLDFRANKISLGGEFIVLGNHSANSAVGGPNNTPLLFDKLGNPTLTLVPGSGFEAQYRQRNGGNNGTFRISEGVVALVRGDGLGELAGTRSRLTIRSNELSIFLLGGAGATFADDVSGQAGTPQVSVLYRTYVDTDSAGLGTGFATYDRGVDHSLDDDDTGVRPLSASEYNTTLNNGDGAVLNTIANTKLNSTSAGINSNTRVNTLLLEQNGAVTGAGTLTVYSGLIMSTGDNGSINTANLDVPSVTQDGSFAGFATTTHKQLSLITPAADDQLTIASNITLVGPLVKNGAGTAILSGTNNFGGNTLYVANGAVRAMDGTSLPSASQLTFTGGVLESSGTFSRNIGISGTDVNWDETSSGGFAAHGAALAIQLNGGIGGVTWNSANFVPGHRSLILGSVTADNVVNFQNDLALGNFAAASNDRTESNHRTIEVLDNPNSVNDFGMISGNITGSDGRLELHKSGDGILKFAGVNTYAGQTIVDAGTLLVNGTTIGQDSYSVRSGATLGGTGTIGLNSLSQVEIANGAMLSAGDGGTGTLTIGGDLLLHENSILAFDLSPASDLIEVTGDLTLDGVLAINDLEQLDNGSYRLFNYSGDLFNNGLTLPSGGFFLDLSTLGQVNLLVVPEPSSLMLLGLGLLGWVRRRGKQAPRA